MLSNIVSDLLRKEAEEMSELIREAGTPVMYSLLQDLDNKKKEIAVFEKKISLANGLLAKINNEGQACKLIKEKEDFEQKKNSLIKLIIELESVQDSIENCVLFYDFVEKFYKFAIKKENFEHSDKNITSKLIYTLKAEEDNLYKSFVEDDYFTKVLKTLSFEPYQCYFEDYTTNFFADIKDLSDPYNTSLFLLTAIFYKFSYFRIYHFNLNDLIFFLSKNIPNLPLTLSTHELIGLRCFFFYNVLLKYLKLKPVNSNFEYLKNSLQFESYIVNFKSSIKENLNNNLQSLQKYFIKKEKKLDNFLENKSEDTDEELNKALIFYSVLEGEVKIINKKTENLIKNSYLNLTKMRYLLEVMMSENELSKLLTVFSNKVNSDFYLYGIKCIYDIKSNKEALNYLFKALSSEKSDSSLHNEIKAFLNSIPEKDQNITPIFFEEINLEDWIDFSHFYIFTLLYINFNARLIGFNNKLLFTEVLTFNIFLMAKLKTVANLKNKVMKEINKFFGNKYSNQSAYINSKNNLLDEIKLILELIQHTTQVLTDTKILESVLIPKIKDNPILPRPDENNLLSSLKSLQDENEFFQLKYNAIKKHVFHFKPRKVVKKSSIKLINNLGNDLEEKYSKFIEYFFEPLSCLSVNFSESLKHIQEIEKNALSIKKNSVFRQKISSSLGQLSSSIDKIILNLNLCLELDEAGYLDNLNLSQLLNKVDELIIGNSLIKKKSLENKLIFLQQLVSSVSLSISLILKKVTEMIDKYLLCNDQAKILLQLISSHFVGETNPASFFSKPMPKKTKRQLASKLPNDYFNLKEQFICLERLIRLMRYETHERVIQLYSLVVEGEDYQKACNLLKEKMSLLKIVPNKSIVKSKTNHHLINEEIAITANIDIPQQVESEKKLECTPIANDLNERLSQVPNVVFSDIPSDTKELIALEDINSPPKDLVINENILTIDVVNKTLSDQEKILNKTILEGYENWNIGFEKWKYEKSLKLYKLLHVIESCAMSVLNNSGNAFLKYLSLYKREFVEKKSELMLQKEQIISFFDKSDKARVLTNYLYQYEEWLDSILHRITVCRALILQNDNQAVIVESPRLPSLLADNRAEFNSLLAFYLGSTDKYNKFRDDLSIEENKLSDLNRSFVKQVLTMVSLAGVEKEGNVLAEFSEQMDKVSQLKLAIEQEYENKKRIKAKLVSIANPEIVKFYLSRIDPCDAETIKANTENNLLPINPTCIPIPPPPAFNVYMAANPNKFYPMPQATTHLLPNFAPVPYCDMCYPNPM